MRQFIVTSRRTGGGQRESRRPSGTEPTSETKTLNHSSNFPVINPARQPPASQAHQDGYRYEAGRHVDRPAEKACQKDCADCVPSDEHPKSEIKQITYQIQDQI